MNDVETQRLAHAINELRPAWPISSLTTFIRRSLSGRNFRDAAVALVWVALDIDGAGNYVTETPKRVLEPGPWWKAAEASGTLDGHRAKPPKRTEQCFTCGRHLDHCVCGERANRPPVAGDAKSGADMCRAVMRGEEEADV